MADKNFPPRHLEREEEKPTPEFSEGATSVLLGTLSHSILCPSALSRPSYTWLRASSILEDFNWAATLVFRVHTIVGMASKLQQFYAERNFGSQNFLALASLEWRTGMAPYRIAGNFRGAYISRIDIKFIFVVTNFADGNY